MRNPEKLAEISEKLAHRVPARAPFENRSRGGAISHAAHTRCIPPHARRTICTVSRPSHGRRRRRRVTGAAASTGLWRAPKRHAGGPLGGTDGENISEFKTPFFNDRGPSTPMPTSDPVRLFCLDRDGVINKDVGVPGVVDVDDFELLPEAARAIRSLNDAGVSVCVVTNQTAVGKGLLPEST